MSQIISYIIDKLLEIRQAVDVRLDNLPSSFAVAVDILKSPVSLPFSISLPFDIDVLTAIGAILLLFIIIVSFISTLGLLHPSKHTLMKWENLKATKAYDKKQKKQSHSETADSISAVKAHTETADLSSVDNLPEEQLKSDSSYSVNNDVISSDIETIAPSGTDAVLNQKKDGEKAQMAATDTSKPSKKELIKAKKEQIRQEKLRLKEEKRKQKEEKNKKSKGKSTPVEKSVPPVKPNKKQTDTMEAFVPSQPRKRESFDYLDDIIENQPKITLNAEGESEIKKTNIIDNETPAEQPETPAEESSIDLDKPTIEKELEDKSAAKAPEAEVKDNVIEDKIGEAAAAVLQIQADNKVKAHENTETDIEISGPVKSDIKSEADIFNYSELPVKKVERPVIPKAREKENEPLPEVDNGVLDDLDDDIFSFIKGEEVDEKESAEVKNPETADNINDNKPESTDKPSPDMEVADIKESAAVDIEAPEIDAAADSVQAERAIESDIIEEPVNMQVESFGNNSSSPNGQYEIISQDGKFRFVLTSDTDEPLYTSRPYKTLTTCINGTLTFKKNVLTGTFTINKDKFGTCRFILTSKTSALVKYDGELFKSEEECKNNIEAVKKFAPIASVIMRT